MNYKNLYLVILTLIAFVSCKNENTKPSNNLNLTVTGIKTIDDLQAKVSVDPNNSDLYFQLGAAYYTNEGFDEAILSLQKAIGLDSTNPAYFSLLGDTYLDYGKSFYALETMQRAVGIMPDHVPTRLQLAEYELTLKQHDQSMSSLAKVLTVDPLNPEALFLLGLNYKIKGDIPKALASFQTATEQDPDYLDAYMELAILCDKEKKDNLARQYFNNALRIDSLNIGVLYAKAMFHQTRYEDNAAITYYQKINQLDKEYAPAFFNQGTIYLEYDSLDQAYDLFNISVSVEPTYAMAYYYRGLALEKKGEINRAISDYQQALAFDSELQKAKDRLKELE